MHLDSETQQMRRQLPALPEHLPVHGDELLPGRRSDQIVNAASVVIAISLIS
ncbi:hypothetical protein [Rhizobium leguminosarum]|uniref:hypothetical protein n=1 Tax=Rhizobium leguminosarum TaxID=384 RepID=UPI0003613C0F|nr:hypothetical protein [Rhizobium leguminosarum]MBY5816112.1 hypothetical protein [Rhizobium leguminosarum]